MAVKGEKGKPRVAMFIQCSKDECQAIVNRAGQCARHTRLEQQKFSK